MPNTENAAVEMSRGVASVREAAAALGLSIRGVQKRIERGQLKAVKLCGRWFIDRRDLESGR